MVDGCSPSFVSLDKWSCRGGPITFYNHKIQKGPEPKVKMSFQFSWLDNNHCEWLRSKPWEYNHGCQFLNSSHLGSNLSKWLKITRKKLVAKTIELEMSIRIWFLE